MSRNYTQRELRLLYTLSGNICAFPECNEPLVHPKSTDDDAVNISDIAHIVADSRQGPRGREEMGEEQRNQHANLILLCIKHHRIVDSQPRTYSVAVLRQMKADHEARVAKLQKGVPQDNAPMVEEIVHSTMLPVTHIPGMIFSAPCKYLDNPREVSRHLTYPHNDRNQLFPFIILEGQLYTFQDIRRKGNAYSDVVNWRQASDTPIEQFCADGEGCRRFVWLLNRALHKYLGRYRIIFNRDHQRYYYPVLTPGTERSIAYRPMNSSETTRKVAWPPRRKATGEAKHFWWHMAVALRWEQVAAKQWYLSIRPERHLTKDGETPFPSEKIGPRVTRLKARMYNDKYLSEVQFWRDILSEGHPRFILNFGDQSLVCDSTLVTYKIRWPGVPDDEKAFRNQQYDEDLFTLTDYRRAIGEGKPVDDDIDLDGVEEEHDE